MRILRIGLLSGGVLIACGLSALGQGSEEVRSRLPCLAPLIWRWESGEFPLTLGEAFFRGPYRFRDFLEVPDEVAVPFPVEDLKEKPEVQRLFDKGVALVYGFRDQEAERAFRQVVDQAPDCAMAYWGLALANGTSPGRARLFASEAKLRLGANPAEDERMWIEWAARFFDDKTEPDEQQRRRRAVRDLEALVRQFPDDLHGRAFLVRQVVLNESRGGLEIGSRLAIDRLMDEIASEVPRYPLRAYRIFLWLKDRPELLKIDPPEFVVPTLSTGESGRFLAELYLAQGDPEKALSPILWAMLIEMPRLKETPWLMEEEGLDEAGMPEDSAILAETAGQFVAILGGMGRMKDADRAAARLSSLPRNPYYRHNLGRDEAVLDARAQVQRERLRSWIEWGMWERILERTSENPAGRTIDNYADSVWISDRVAARAVADLHLGNQDGFQRGVRELEQFAEQLPVSMRNRGVAADYASGLADQLGDYEEFCEGAEPNPNGYGIVGKSRMARICLESGRIEEALRLVDEDLAGRPGFFGARANASAIRFKTGKVKEAIFLMDREFRQQAGRADPDLPVMKELDEVAAVLKLPKNWKLGSKTEKAESKSENEVLKWKLPEASPWTLPNWKGEEVSLAQFSGKPVLLVFFLGGGCLHCVQQLTALIPRVPEYRAAGIPIVAISTDGAEILSRTLGKEVDPEKSFPFEIVSDRELKVFKSYGVFDQFEKRALHGTFLLDGEGRIIWRELSHEPFLKPDFLLEEARRLLNP